MKKLSVLLFSAVMLLASCGRNESKPPIINFYNNGNEIVTESIDVPINSYQEIEIELLSATKEENYPLLGWSVYTLTKPDGEVMVLCDSTTINHDCFRIVHSVNSDEERNEEHSLFFMDFGDSICNVGDQYILNVSTTWVEPVEKSLKLSIVE